jgi:hypothetical protein
LRRVNPINLQDFSQTGDPMYAKLAHPMCTSRYRQRFLEQCYSEKVLKSMSLRGLAGLKPHSYLFAGLS